MVKIRSAVRLTDRAWAARIDGVGVLHVFGVAEVEGLQIKGVGVDGAEDGAMACRAGGEHAVEGVDAVRNCAAQRVRVADAQQMAGLGADAWELVQLRRHPGEQREHLVLGAAHGAADGQAVERKRGEKADAAAAEIEVAAAVDDAVDGLLPRVPPVLG